jgi:hypothetical protein
MNDKPEPMDERTRDIVDVVVTTLTEKGYSFANEFGARQETCSGIIGILKDRDPIQKRFLGLIPYSIDQKALHIGTLYIDDSLRNMNPLEKWYLEVYGIDNINPLKEAISPISNSYGVNLEVNIEVKPRIETVSLQKF